ncbi:MAG: hypothetical protein KGI38_02165 [Thaumarchaeota archaeon]|nr:hypothetical protein [Nitrososphaerota archaeon]
MLPKLLKFVVRTRFSRPFLILIAILFTYSVVISAIIPPQGLSFIFGYYVVAIVALFLAMTLATGGIMVLKSDRDYLFTLPLSTRDLSISIFFAQFIAFGTTVLLMFGYLAQGFTSAFLIADMVALALIFTALGVIAPSIQTRTRLALSLGLALWTLLAFAKIPFTPGSAFNGDVYSGTATLVLLAAVTLAAAFRGLSRIELDMMRSMVRSTSTEIKSPNSYVGKSPKGAIYSMNLSSISLAGRMNMAGTSRYVSRRVKTRWVVAVTSGAAAAYFVAALLKTITKGFGLPEVFASIGLVFFAFFLSQSAITNERTWLSLASLPAATYFRHLIASRLLSLLTILAPFAVADVALLALGHVEALGALVVVTVVIPGTYVIEVLFSAYVAPIQVKGDDMTMPAQFSLKQLATALPVGGSFILVSAATISPTFAVVGGAALCAVGALFVMSQRFWNGVVTRLTESGFV